MRLHSIVEFFNKHKRLPDEVDSSEQFLKYKSFLEEDVSKTMFKTLSVSNISDTCISISSTIDEPQFSNYSKINYKQLTPFIYAYFSLSDQILEHYNTLQTKYNIRLENTCGVMYRGGDKIKETNVPSYEVIINKAIEFQKYHPNVQFILQSDEIDFVHEFQKTFPSAVYFEETFQYPNIDYYLASIYLFSKFKNVITTSGNGELFIALYRGHSNGIIQYLNRRSFIYGQPTLASEPTDTPFWYDYSWNFIDKVVYINIDERTDRREHMENKILNVFVTSKVQRFSAVKHERGNIGCTRSHIEVLKMAIREGWKNVLILEDDAEWNKYEEGYAKLQELMKHPYDVIMLSPSAAQWDPNTMRLFESETSCGYIVSDRYFVTLLKHYQHGLELLESTGNSNLYVMDEHWKSIQKRDIWYTIIPAMIYQRPGYSDIFCRDVDYRYRVCL